MPLPTVAATRQVEDRTGEHVEERRPEHGLPGLEHAGGYHGRDGVRGVVEAVHEIERQCQQHQQHQRQRNSPESM